MATSWHRQHNDGLWLDEGNGSEAARKIQTHPWIDTPLFDESESEDEERSTNSVPDFDQVVSWRTNMLEEEEFEKNQSHVEIWADEHKR
ncbi:hypothetical protein MMC13_005909 [Lambiella insularis]|nr:hypothetical protein [Lambiella insularis]